MTGVWFGIAYGPFKTHAPDSNLLRDRDLKYASFLAKLLTEIMKL